MLFRLPLKTGKIFLHIFMRKSKMLFRRVLKKMGTNFLLTTVSKVLTSHQSEQSPLWKIWVRLIVGNFLMAFEIKVVNLHTLKMRRNEVVKIGFFRKIFNRNFNLGFCSPRTDMCSTCISLDEQIKRSKDGELVELMTAKRLHKQRHFLNCCRSDLVTFSFDMQKNLPLPKIPDQQAYYSRQLYLHNFTLVQGHSKAPLANNSFYSYV